jgi:hypothetical protein
MHDANWQHCSSAVMARIDTANAMRQKLRLAANLLHMQAMTAAGCKKCTITFSNQSELQQ